MIRTCGWLAPLFVLLCTALPARAEGASNTSGSEKSPALPYAVAGLSTVLLLYTVCKPSKKQFYE